MNPLPNRKPVTAWDNAPVRLADVLTPAQQAAWAARRMRRLAAGLADIDARLDALESPPRPRPSRAASPAPLRAFPGPSIGARARRDDDELMLLVLADVL